MFDKFVESVDKGCNKLGNGGQGQLENHHGIAAVPDHKESAMNYPEDIVESARLAACFTGNTDTLFRVVANMLMAERNRRAGNREQDARQCGQWAIENHRTRAALSC